MTHEEQYIVETGNKKPDIKDHYDDFDEYREYYKLLSAWCEHYSTWLSARLERVERQLKLTEINSRHEDKNELSDEDC